MYDTLRPELITATSTQRRAMKYDPTEVVSFDLFQQNQFPYLEVCGMIDMYTCVLMLLR